MVSYKRNMIVLMYHKKKKLKKGQEDIKKKDPFGNYINGTKQKFINQCDKRITNCDIENVLARSFIGEKKKQYEERD